MAQYYINTASSGSGDGTTTAITGANAAWAAFSEITGLAAGDTVSLNKGNTWRETLTVGTSGSAGSPITFNAYGSGADPIISGADVIETWTSASQDVLSALTTDFDAGGRSNDRSHIPASSLNVNATRIRLKFEAHSSSTTTISAATIGLRDGSTEDFDGAPTPILFSTSPSTTLAAGTTKWSDWMTYSIDSTKDYLVHVWANGVSPNIRCTSVGDSVGTYYGLSADTGDSSAVEDWTADGQYAGKMGFIVQIEGGYSNVWQAACTTEPSQVFFDGTKGTKAASVATIDAENEWFWDSDVLYIYYEEDPDGAVVIEASVRDRGILVFQVDYITVDNLTLKHANYHGIQFGRTANSTATNLLCTYNYQNGILCVGHVDEHDDTVLIEDCELSYNGADGVEVSNYCDNTTIRRVEAHHNGTDSDTFVNSAGIYLAHSPAHAGSTWTNNIVEYCTSHNNGTEPAGNDAGAGIWYDEIHDGGGHIVRYNVCYANRACGIWIEDTDGIEVYYNLLYGATSSDSADAGIGLRAGVITKNSKFYNNVCYGNRLNIVTGSYTTSDAGNFTGNEFKNNIAFGAVTTELVAEFGGENDGTFGSGNVYLNNCLGAEYANFIEWGNGVYKSTYDAWETAYGSSTNSVESDPLMTDPASDDFTLQITSSCINTGVDVSLTTDYAGATVTVPPNIGAYETVYPFGGGGLKMGMGLGLT